MRKLIPLFGKLFNIRHDEWPRFIFIYCLYFIILLGMQWGQPIVEAEFVTAIGVGFLPYAYIINAFTTIIVSVVYTAFADRVDNTKLLLALLTSSVLGIGLGLVLLDGNLVAAIYPLLILFLVLNVPLQDIFNIHWPTFVNGFYNTQSAKRIIPLLASGARFAGIFAGLTLPYLNNFFESSTSIITIWLGSLLVAIVLIFLMPYLVKDEEPKERQIIPATKPSQQSINSALDNIKEGFRYVSESSFLRWLAVATLLTFALLRLLNFQALQILQGQYSSKEEISNFLATLNLFGNLIALPIQLFVLNRLIGRVGLGNTSLIFPTGILAISSSLFFQRLVPTLVAALTHVSSTVFRTTFRNPVDNLWYNAVPLRVKGRARAFTVGFVVPLGALIGGLLLLIPNIENTSWLLILSVVIALAFTLVSIMVRRQYGQALISMLEQEDFSFLFSQEGGSLTAADPATLNSLRQKLYESKTPELTIFIAQLIGQAGGPAAVPLLAEATRKARNQEVQAALLDVITAADLGGQTARELYLDFLADESGQVRYAAVVGLSRLDGAKDEQFRTLLLNMLYDPDIQVRVQVLLELAQSGEFYRLPQAVEALNHFLGEQDPERRAYAMRILGQIGDQRAIKNLTDYLTDSDDVVRLAAAMAIEPLLGEDLPAPLMALILERGKTLLNDPIERVRQVALNILGHLGKDEAYQAIIESLDDPSPLVSGTAADVLVHLGKAIIPLTHPELESPNLKRRKMAALVLAQINPKQFAGLVQSHITGNLLTIYQNYGYIEALSKYEYASIPILGNVLDEQNHQLRAEIFYILGAINPDVAVEVIPDTLQSENIRVRANAIEALESITDPQTAQLIAPLFQPGIKSADLIRIGYDSWEIKKITPEQTVRQIITDANTPWLRAIMTYVIGEMGVAHTASAKQADVTQEQSKPARRRRGRIDPLAALSTSSDDDKSDQPQKQRRARPVDLLAKLAPDEPIPPIQIDAPEPPVGDKLAANTDLLPMKEIQQLLLNSARDPAIDVRSAARTAQRMLKGIDIIEEAKKEDVLLSTVERVIFLKQVPFFKGMTVSQLEVLANICEEEVFEEDQWIFRQGDPGGALYVIISGQVGIEQEKRKNSYARLATLNSYHYFGEMTLLDKSPRSAGAIALQDTFILRVRREPLIALARQYPDLSLELINVLSQRLRDANNRIADLTRSRPRQLQKLYDKFDSYLEEEHSD